MSCICFLSAQLHTITNIIPWHRVVLNDEFTSRPAPSRCQCHNHFARMHLLMSRDRRTPTINHLSLLLVQDVLMNLAKAVANAAAMLVLKAKNVAQVAEDTVLQNRVIAAATQCALSTSQLVACAKVRRQSDWREIQIQQTMLLLYQICV